MSTPYEELMNEEWLATIGFQPELAHDLVIRDRRATMRSRKQIESIFIAWLDHGCFAGLGRDR